MEKASAILIDPLKMNIVNRIAPGTVSNGTLQCKGGLLLQGEFHGTLIVLGGPLVLMKGAVLSGELKCNDNAYLFGTVTQKAPGVPSELTVLKTAFLTETVDVKANIKASAIKAYHGYKHEGRSQAVLIEKL